MTCSPLIVECEAVVYPAVERVSHGGSDARRVLRVDQRMITELRHELRATLQATSTIGLARSSARVSTRCSCC